MPLHSEIDSQLDRWVEARIIDYSTADRIREFESERSPRRHSNWMVILAVAFGAAMLAAGVLLFVAAHWDDLSPAKRFILVLAMVAGFHVAAGLLTDRVRSLGTALHAVGTICLGGGIFLAGQIFNLQEHWPGGVMLWAIGSLASWIVLRDTPQALIAAILVPSWIGSELSVRYEHYAGIETATAQYMFMVALFFLGVRTADRHFARAMHIVGGVLLLPAFIFMQQSAHYSRYWERLTPATGLSKTITALVVFGLPLICAWLTRGRRAAFDVGMAAWLVIAAALAAQHDEIFVNLALYGWCALAAIGMTVWGVKVQNNSFINMGVLSFAFTIGCFYFSSVMDKLGRSASLIGFGLLFLLGGWYLEKLRRKLILRSAGGAQ